MDMRRTSNRGRTSGMGGRDAHPHSTEPITERHVFAGTELRLRLVTALAIAVMAALAIWLGFAAASLEPVRIGTALHAGVRGLSLAPHHRA
jgi:hypothetical protein